MKSFVCVHLLALVFWLSACGFVSGDENGAVASNAAISSIRAATLQWFQKITVEAYEKVGSRSPKWDVEAREALNKWAMLRAGTLADVKENRDIVKQGFSKAKAVGCDDPLVAYAAHRSAVSHLPAIERVDRKSTRLNSSHIPL